MYFSSARQGYQDLAISILLGTSQIKKQGSRVDAALGRQLIRGAMGSDGSLPHLTSSRSHQEFSLILPAPDLDVRQAVCIHQYDVLISL